MISIYKPSKGDKVTFIGYTKEQVNWGSNDTPDMLTIGEAYTISWVDRRSSHTKVSVEEVSQSLCFNSVHFAPIEQ